MYKIIFGKKANEEFDTSFSWYEEKKPGLGNIFEEEIQTVLRKISEQPQNSRLGKPPYREAVVKKFPFLITIV